MLSMKTLRVAIVTMGSALLLGPGIAGAQTVLNLDGTAAAQNLPVPIRIAAESIETDTDSSVTSAGSVVGYNVNVGDVQLRVSARTALPDDYFVRVKLTGGVFRGTVAGPTGYTAVQGGAGMDQIVFSVPDAGVPLDGAFEMDVDTQLGVTNTSPGTVSASILAYRDQFDAIDGQGALGTQYFGGSATIIEKVSGVTAVVRPGSTATADVGVGFLWFVNPAADETGHANTAMATLGSFVVAERTAGDLATIDAETGTAIAEDSLIPPAAGVHLRIEGNLGIGAFSLTRDDPTTGTEAMPMVEVTCPDPETGTEDVPLTGNVRGTMDMPNVATVSTGESTDGGRTPVFGADGATGTYTLCVTVDTMGAMSNMMPLPVTEYMGTILLPQTPLPPRELATGVVGKIERNGASVEVAYLTDADIYNQRLIIVNRAGHEVEFTVTDMQSEDGTTVTVNELEGGNMIGMGATRVIKVGDLFSFDGKNRLGATISFNATPGDISVATSQINLDDFSTDTVMWPVD